MGMTAMSGGQHSKEMVEAAGVEPGQGTDDTQVTDFRSA
ncbi:MAG: hypothetical protein QOK38_1863 [Acidobacteriaceae bacterium]|jgi:hypothetical protein|nr:hypothetical protein [Acidobacteriaceae bacterium]